MIILIDNYDSFTYNLYQLLGSIRPDVRVIRNDAMGVAELKGLEPDALVLSPGPGRPDEAGVCEAAVLALSGVVPILGVCLGHQAICEALGATIVHAEQITHGKSSLAALDEGSRLFGGIGPTARVGRYHSLEVDPKSLPACLRVSASTETGEVMAVEHLSHPTFGLQFHPESILTPSGEKIVRNFMSLIE